jgi:hypothetical protein
VIKADEIEFMKRVAEFGFKIPMQYWRGLTKREYYLLSKWSGKGYWDYGVSLRSGWVTDDGKKYFESINSGDI